MFTSELLLITALLTVLIGLPAAAVLVVAGDARRGQLLPEDARLLEPAAPWASRALSEEEARGEAMAWQALQAGDRKASHVPLEG